jgi:hypothetical protein
METASGRIVALTKADAGGLTVSADLQDRADVLRLSYDREDASGRPQHYIELSARPQRFGGLVQELTLDWLRLPANAEAIGRRILGRLAGERYLVSCKARRKDLRAAGWASLVSHPEWPFDGDPTLMVLRAEVTPGRAAVAIEAEVMREWPTIEVTAHSIALPVTTEGGIDVSVRDGIALFTITDADKKPLKDARVSLDGGLAKKTDERGQVSFVIAQTKGEPKPHELVIEAPGFFSQTLEILL